MTTEQLIFCVVLIGLQVFLVGWIASEFREREDDLLTEQEETVSREATGLGGSVSRMGTRPGYTSIRTGTHISTHTNTEKNK